MFKYCLLSILSPNRTKKVTVCALHSLDEAFSLPLKNGSMLKGKITLLFI